MSEQKISNKNHLLSWIIFLPTLIIVSFTIILGMFPALVIVFSDKMKFTGMINPFEPGIWMFPILITNSIIFATIILYQKNKLPQNLTSLFRFILNFEISHRTALVLVGVLITSYVLLNGGELYQIEPWSDFDTVESALQDYSFDEIKFNFRMIPYFFEKVTGEIFDSYRIAGFIASIFCLFLTYLVTVQISKKRFAGIIALIIVLQSQNFLIYDTLATYPIFWIMFYLLSMYLIFKIFLLSPISFGAAVLSHPLSMGLLPISITFIALLDLPKRKKILSLSSYLIFILIGLVLGFTQIIQLPFGLLEGNTSSTDSSRIITSFASIITQFRYDGLIVVFLLPLVVSLFLASKRGILNANAVLSLIGGIILLIALVPFMTNLANTPYRILPLVFFFAIGVGTLLSKNINLQDKLLSNSSIKEDSRKKNSEKNKKRSDTIGNSKHKSPSSLK